MGNTGSDQCLETIICCLPYTLLVVKKFFASSYKHLYKKYILAGVERREQVSIRKTETFNENGLQGHPDYQLFWCVMVEKK